MLLCTQYILTAEKERNVYGFFIILTLEEALTSSLVHGVSVRGEGAGGRVEATWVCRHIVR